MLDEEQKRVIEEEKRKILDNLQRVKHRVVIFSGKGGVGKTTVSINLAYALSRRGRSTGILDADVTGPDVPKMLALSEKPYTVQGRISPVEVNGVKIISMASIIPHDQPVIWRGPLRSKLLNQFLSDVEWGDLDYLIADLPPGTGDEILTMTQNMFPNMAIIVTTPQGVSLIDSGRAINMAKRMGIKNIGVIENMSGFRCPNCGYKVDLFSSGGGKWQARDMGVRFLGELPISLELRELSDVGRPIVLENPNSEISDAFIKISIEVQKTLESQEI